MASEPAEMSFLDHLEELRRRLFKAIVAVVVCAVPCGVYWKKIFDIVMIYPLKLADPQPALIYTSPAEPILLSIKIAVAGGLIISSPFVFYQIWRFVAPGLYKKEKVVILPVVIASSLFFILGILFSYLTIPFVIHFLVRFAEGKLDAFYRAQEYLGFLLKLAIAFGVVFELPVVSFVLSKMGLVTPKLLLVNFRYAIVAIFILAALLTPPDIVSQMFLAMPLLVLYGVSILVSYVVVRRKRD